MDSSKSWSPPSIQKSVDFKSVLKPSRFHWQYASEFPTGTLTQSLPRSSELPSRPYFEALWTKALTFGILLGRSPLQTNSRQSALLRKQEFEGGKDNEKCYTSRRKRRTNSRLPRSGKRGHAKENRQQCSSLATQCTKTVVADCSSAPSSLIAKDCKCDISHPKKSSRKQRPIVKASTLGHVRWALRQKSRPCMPRPDVSQCTLTDSRLSASSPLPIESDDVRISSVKSDSKAPFPHVKQPSIRTGLPASFLDELKGKIRKQDSTNPICPSSSKTVTDVSLKSFLPPSNGACAERPKGLVARSKGILEKPKGILEKPKGIVKSPKAIVKSPRGSRQCVTFKESLGVKFPGQPPGQCPSGSTRNPRVKSKEKVATLCIKKEAIRLPVGRRLNWKPFGPNFTEATIFDEDENRLSDCDIFKSIDQEIILHSFKKRKSSIKWKSIDSKKSNTLKLVELLSLQKAQNLMILEKKMDQKPEMLVQKIFNLDCQLTKQHLETFMKFIPDSEEVKKFEDFIKKGGVLNELREIEQLVFQLLPSKQPTLVITLNLLLIRQEVIELQRIMLSDLEKVVKVLVSIYNNRGLKILFAICLHFGNCITTGTLSSKESTVSGFYLESLKILSNFKSTLVKGSALDYILINMVVNCNISDVTDLLSLEEYLNPILRVSQSVMEQSMKRLRERLKKSATAIVDLFYQLSQVKGGGDTKLQDTLDADRIRFHQSVLLRCLAVLGPAAVLKLIENIPGKDAIHRITTTTTKAIDDITLSEKQIGLIGIYYNLMNTFESVRIMSYHVSRYFGVYEAFQKPNSLGLSLLTNDGVDERFQHSTNGSIDKTATTTSKPFDFEFLFNPICDVLSSLKLVLKDTILFKQLACFLSDGPNQSHHEDSIDSHRHSMDSHRHVTSDFLCHIPKTLTFDEKLVVQNILKSLQIPRNDKLMYHHVSIVTSFREKLLLFKSDLEKSGKFDFKNKLEDKNKSQQQNSTSCEPRSHPRVDSKLDHPLECREEVKSALQQTDHEMNHSIDTTGFCNEVVSPVRISPFSDIMHDEQNALSPSTTQSLAYNDHASRKLPSFFDRKPTKAQRRSFSASSCIQLSTSDNDRMKTSGKSQHPPLRNERLQSDPTIIIHTHHSLSEGVSLEPQLLTTFTASQNNAKMGYFNPQEHHSLDSTIYMNDGLSWDQQGGESNNDQHIIDHRSCEQSTKFDDDCNRCTLLSNTHPFKTDKIADHLTLQHPSLNVIHKGPICKSPTTKRHLIENGQHDDDLFLLKISLSFQDQETSINSDYSPEEAEDPFETTLSASSSSFTLSTESHWSGCWEVTTFVMSSVKSHLGQLQSHCVTHFEQMYKNFQYYFEKSVLDFSFHLMMTSLFSISIIFICFRFNPSFRDWVSHHYSGHLKWSQQKIQFNKGHFTCTLFKLSPL